MMTKRRRMDAYASNFFSGSTGVANPLVLGSNGGASGSIVLNGSTSGSLTLAVNSTASILTLSPVGNINCSAGLNLTGSSGSQLLLQNGVIITSTSGVKLQGFALNQVSKIALYTTLQTDDTILCNGTFTVTLVTPAIGKGKRFTVKNIGAGTITVAGQSGTIDGAASINLTTSTGITSFLTAEWDGSNWWIVG